MAVNHAPAPRERARRKHSPEPSKESPGAFRVEPHDFRFDPRINLDKLNQLVDELDSCEAVKKLGK